VGCPFSLNTLVHVGPPLETNHPFNLMPVCDCFVLRAIAGYIGRVGQTRRFVAVDDRSKIDGNLFPQQPFRALLPSKLP